VPEALSFAPGPLPSLSRCAITTIVRGDFPTASATRFSIFSRPWPGMTALKRSVVTGKPYGLIWSRNQSAAPSEPGKRFACRVTRSAARSLVAFPSNSGRNARGSGVGLATLNAARSNGKPTSSHVPR